MVTERAAEICANCGAPFDVDARGNCTHCGAHLSPTPAAEETAPAFSSMVLGDGGLGLPLPAFPLLSGLEMISMEAVVQAALDHSGELEGARHLVEAVKAAGERAADAGLDGMTDDPGAYEPAELWVFQLARDLLAQLASVEGVDRDSARLARQTVTGYNDHTWQRAFEKVNKKLDHPPEELADLRTKVPRLG